MKNAQLQTQETILVLFIVIVLILFGLAFFVKYEQQSIESERHDYERIQFQNLITTLPEQPAIKCSSFAQKEACVDSLKILAAATNKQLLAQHYPNMNITFTQLYPITTAHECTTTTFIDCNHWTLFAQRPTTITSTMKTITPISLYRPETREHVLGLLIIEGYNL